MRFKPQVGVIMGSQSDWPTLRCAVEVLEALQISFEKKIVSAHRTPQLLYSYAQSAQKRGLRCIIAGAGGAAHLPGMTAALTSLPVLGVPVCTKTLDGIDSFLSIAQMPAGIPVATFCIGQKGARDAGLFAAQILAQQDKELDARLNRYLKSKPLTVKKKLKKHDFAT